MTTMVDIYNKRFNDVLLPLSKNIERHLFDTFNGVKNIDAIKVRAKSIESFINKTEKINDDGKKCYDDPLNQIQDQIGARIIVYYLNDIETIDKTVSQYFTSFEEQFKEPEKPHEFGYVGKHYILSIPLDTLNDEMDQSLIPKFFELQIKTLFQHAWGQANHDICYKSKTTLSNEQKRKIAFTAAQSWGADKIFEELWGSLNNA